VMVHVVEAARVVASSETVGQLQQAMTDLEKARVVLDNQIQQTADMQEKQVLDLRNTVQKQDVSLRAAATPLPAPKCPVPAAVKKKKRVTNPSATTTKPAAGSPSTQAKPQ
jgi:BRCT domain type II-containing protein